MLTQFVGFVIFMIAVQAELTQAPFDMPIAESELVSGYMTEYSGFRFLIFFIGEFATAGVFAFIASVLFLGGWGVPFSWFGWETLDDVDDWMNVVGPLIMLAKMMLLAGIIMWVRFSYPRFREDQLQRFAWKVLIPISLAQHRRHGGPEGGYLMPQGSRSRQRSRASRWPRCCARSRTAPTPSSTRTPRRRRPSAPAA